MWLSGIVSSFRYVITESPDIVWGQRLPNGTWAGMTGMLHRKVGNEKFFCLFIFLKLNTYVHSKTRANTDIQNLVGNSDSRLFTLKNI